MKKRILSLALAVIILTTAFCSMSKVVFALDINIDAFEKAGNKLDNLINQLDNLDLNNLPADEPAKESTDNTADIKTNMMIAARNTYTLGLQNNGRVLAKGFSLSGADAFTGWSSITMIAAGFDHSVGLKSDGTVLAIGKNCGGILNTSSWKNIVAISASDSDILGLDKSGKVYSTYANKNEVAKFTDVVAIAGTEMYAAALKKDGTVVTSSDVVDVSGWKNIIAIAGGTSHIVGLKSDGTVVAVEIDGGWKLGQTDVGGWQLNAYRDKPVNTTPGQ